MDGLYNDTVTTTEDIRAMFDPYLFPMALFTLNETGPIVLYNDLEECGVDLNLTKSPEEFLQNLAVGSIVAFGQGHSYAEGVFDFPAGDIKEYRTLLVSFKMGNPDAVDRRLLVGFYQLAIFMPLRVIEMLPAFVNFEREIFNLVRKHKNSNELTAGQNLHHLKKDILNKLFSAVNPS